MSKESLAETLHWVLLNAISGDLSGDDPETLTRLLSLRDALARGDIKFGPCACEAARIFSGACKTHKLLDCLTCREEEMDE